MRLHHPLCTLLVALACPPALAGSVAATHYSELDGSLSAGLPGRVMLYFDQSAAARNDVGIHASSDEWNRITTVAEVDLENADPNLVGIGLGRVSYYGYPDSTFDGDGKRVKDAFLTDVVDACTDPLGRIVVAGTTPGANGSGGNQDLALVRFNADGTDDTSFAGDGGVTFTFADTTGEWSESITDLDCLPNGNLLIGGWFYDPAVGDSAGFVAEMPATGAATPIRRLNSYSPPGYDHVVTMAEELNGAIVQSAYSTQPGGPAIVSFLSPQGSTYTNTSGRSSTSFSPSESHCGAPEQTYLDGLAELGTGDYVLTGTREDAGGNRIGVLARIKFGAIKRVACTDVGFGVANAYTRITPPVVSGNRIFVALGWLPGYANPLTSRLRAYTAPTDGSAPLPASGFGVSGMAQWNYPFSTTQPGTDRSWVRRLYLDGGLGLMAVGTAAMTGADTDVVLARFGSPGVFNAGFETVAP